MKNILWLCLLLCIGIRIEAATITVPPCDTIVKTNGELVLGTKIRNSGSMVTYQPCGGFAGETYSIPRSEVQTIRFISIPDRAPEGALKSISDRGITRMAMLTMFSGIGSMLLIFLGIFLSFLWMPVLTGISLAAGVILSLVAIFQANAFFKILRRKKGTFQKEKSMVIAGLIGAIPVLLALAAIAFILLVFPQD